MNFSFVSDISAFASFLEGVLSFFSPCVLPLLPVYFSFLSGGNAERDENGEIIYKRSKVVINTLFFVLGISLTFFILSLGVKGVGKVFSSNSQLFSIIGGTIVIIFGIWQLVFYGTKYGAKREKRINLNTNRAKGPLLSFLLGFSFSFSWTPCIGPILSSVIIMASSSVKGEIYLLLYALGFTLPFILLAFFTSSLLSFFQKYKRVVKYTVRIGALVMILLGIMMIVTNIPKVSEEEIESEEITIKETQIESEEVAIEEIEIQIENTSEENTSKVPDVPSSKEEIEDNTNAKEENDEIFSDAPSSSKDTPENAEVEETEQNKKVTEFFGTKTVTVNVTKRQDLIDEYMKQAAAEENSVIENSESISESSEVEESASEMKDTREIEESKIEITNTTGNSGESTKDTSSVENKEIETADTVSEENTVYESEEVNNIEETKETEINNGEKEEPTEIEKTDEEIEEQCDLDSLDFTFLDQNGKIHRLSSYKEKVIFLNAWATWCGPCRSELPEIDEIYKKYKDSNDVVILTVAFPGKSGEGDVSSIKSFMKSNGYSYPVLLDTKGKLLSALGITAFPTTFLFDKKGNIYGYVPGAMKIERMEEVIELTLNAQ